MWSQSAGRPCLQHHEDLEGGRAAAPSLFSRTGKARTGPGGETEGETTLRFPASTYHPDRAVRRRPARPLVTAEVGNDPGDGRWGWVGGWVCGGSLDSPLWQAARKVRACRPTAGDACEAAAARGMVRDTRRRARGLTAASRLPPPLLDSLAECMGGEGRGVCA